VAGVRPDRLPPVTPLTARDRALLAQLAEHEPLATSELLLLFFTGPRTCRQRLTQLERAELLLRVYPAAGRRGTGEALWFLTARARLLLAAPTRRTPSLSLPDLEHRRAVARFFCALVERSLQHPGEGLWCWQGEARAEKGIGGRIRPDGYGRYLLPNGEVTFYLELDRATEQGKRVGDKLAGYTRALANVDGRERANILLACQSQRRLRNLAAHAPTGPPWVWGTTDSRGFQLLPALTEQRRFDELPLWSRDPAHPVSDCLGRRWQAWGRKQWHTRRNAADQAVTPKALGAEDAA
jgi:hypothetical protein